MNTISIGIAHRALERRVERIERFLSGLGKTTIRSSLPNGIHEVFDVLATTGSRTEKRGFHMDVQIAGILPGSLDVQRVIYFRFGEFVGMSDDNGFPPWDKRSEFFDADIFPDEKDPQENGGSHWNSPTIGGDGSA